MQSTPSTGFKEES